MKKIICISEGSDGVDFARLITNEFATTGLCIPVVVLSLRRMLQLGELRV